ncbi:hypothetical protein Hanom_Chr01g00041041 [Helianthus anomalus]
MLMLENELLKKMVNDHEADKQRKSKQMDMLFVVFESKLGTSVQAEYDQIEIGRAEARRIEREKKAAEEVAAMKDRGKKIVDYDDTEDGNDEDKEEDDELDDLSDSANYPTDDDDDDDDAKGGGGARNL